MDKTYAELYEEAKKLTAHLCDKDISPREGAVVCAITLSAILKASNLSKHEAVSFFMQFLNNNYEEERV
jgi:hypothetical protein